MFKLISRAKLLWAVYRYLQDPNQVDSVLKLGNQLLSQDSLSDSKQRYFQNKDVIEMLKSRPGLKQIDLAEFKNLPLSTLGGAYYHFITSQNLDSYFYQKNTNIHLENDNDYLVYRIRQTHDLWHLVTGFETSQEGEAGLIAFYYAQLRSPLSALIIGLAFIHFLLKRPNELPLLFDKVNQGWEMGKKALPLLTFKWEENWKSDLIQIRKDLCIINYV